MSSFKTQFMFNFSHWMEHNHNRRKNKREEKWTKKKEQEKWNCIWKWSRSSAKINDTQKCCAINNFSPFSLTLSNNQTQPISSLSHKIFTTQFKFNTLILYKCEYNKKKVYKKKKKENKTRIIITTVNKLKSS